jgi:hypothetical protein
MLSDTGKACGKQRQGYASLKIVLPKKHLIIVQLSQMPEIP